MTAVPFLERLQALYPPGAVLHGPAVEAAYASDALNLHRGRPLCVVLPEHAEQVAATVRLCRRYGVPFVARGAGTGLAGGAVPVDGGVVLALNRMDRVLRVDPDNLRAVAQPGATTAAISRAAARYGLHYAPDPSSQAACTIGGNVACNAGGAHGLKYGSTASHVLALRVVLPTGELVDVGHGSLDLPGPDLVGLLCGSEGTLGVVVEVTVRLLPRREAARTVAAAYACLEDAGAAVTAVVRAGLLPAALEIMDRTTVEAVMAFVDAGYPSGAGAVVIAELDGPADEVEAQLPRLVEVLQGAGALAIRAARDARERELLWRGRRAVFAAVGRVSPNALVEDGVVPRGRLAEALRRIEAIAAAHGVRVATVAHAGDGNLHPKILLDAADPQALARARAAGSAILDLCLELGGSITGEHGVGLEKREHLRRMFDEDSLAAMRRLRRSLDPDGLANPDKVLPCGRRA